MPRRNLVMILAVAMLSLAFHAKARQLRYAGPFSEAVDLIKRRYYRDVDEHGLFDSAMAGMIPELPSSRPRFVAESALARAS